MRPFSYGLPPNSMFGPKSPAERAVPRDSVISWANYESVGGYCQHVYFGQNAQQMEPLGWVPGWWSSPRRCALARQGVEGKRLRLSEVPDALTHQRRLCVSASGTSASILLSSRSRCK